MFYPDIDVAKALCCTKTYHYDFINLFFIKIFENPLKISILQNIYAIKPKKLIANPKFF